MIDALLKYIDDEAKAKNIDESFKPMPQLHLQFRVIRDRARVLALLNRNE